MNRLRNTVALLLIALPLAARAQFQAPNPDELKMTSDPKAPGAAAVFLEYREADNEPLHFRDYYARIKVLTEKGKELATVEIPYLSGPFDVTDIQGRTIHPDGTVIPLVGRPDTLLQLKKGDFDIEKKVFTLPSVEVGSILEYSFRVGYRESFVSSPDWEIQKPYFVHKAHYQFTPFKQFMPGGAPLVQEQTGGEQLIDSRGRIASTLFWWDNLPSGVSLKIKGGAGSGEYYAVDLTDVPPTPDEEWMPPINTFCYRVQFYYQYATNLTTFWKTESGLWSKDVDHFAEPTKTIRAAVAGLVAPGDSELEKAQKLYAAVQALDNTDFSRQKSASELKALKLKTARRAEDTWSQKSGSANDLAMLYLAMLRAAGLHAYGAIVVDRGERAFDQGYMNFDQLSEMLVILDTDGKEIYLDPGEKMCPFGLLHWRHSGATGIRQSAAGLELTTTADQDYAANTVQRAGAINLDANGSVSGSFNVIMKGQEALRWRQIALRNDETEAKKQFDEDLRQILPQGVEAHVDHFLGLDQYESNLIAAVTVQGAMGTAMSKRWILPGFFFESRNGVPFVNEEKRLEPVDMHYGSLITDDVTYRLPAGMQVEGAPQDTNVTWERHAVYAMQVTSRPGEIDVVRTLVRGFSTLNPAEYPDLRGFYQKTAAADQQQLVLRVAAAAQGN